MNGRFLAFLVVATGLLGMIVAGCYYPNHRRAYSRTAYIYSPAPAPDPYEPSDDAVYNDGSADTADNYDGSADAVDQPADNGDIRDRANDSFDRLDEEIDRQDEAERNAKEEAERAEATAIPTPGKPYIVRAGDSLASISVVAYGTPMHWRSIATENGFADGNQIRPGVLLHIPQVNETGARTVVGSDAETPAQTRTLTRDGLMQMVRAGVDDANLVLILERFPTDIVLDGTIIAELRSEGVSNHVIEVLVRKVTSNDPSATDRGDARTDRPAESNSATTPEGDGDAPTEYPDSPFAGE